MISVPSLTAFKYTNIYAKPPEEFLPYLNHAFLMSPFLPMEESAF